MKLHYIFFFTPQRTTAISGTITTKYFGDLFNANQVERHVWYSFGIFPPKCLEWNPNVTLHIELQKVTMNNFVDGYGNDKMVDRWEITIHENKNFSEYYSPPRAPPSTNDDGYDFRLINLLREVTLKDLKDVDMNEMPGFKISWFYTGITGTGKTEENEIPKYADTEITKNYMTNTSM